MRGGWTQPSDDRTPECVSKLDQIEVLCWVQEHIENFGGDLNNATLFGESGGGHAAQRPETVSEISAYVFEQLALKARDIETLRRVP